jgi:hypothetical protein
MNLEKAITHHRGTEFTENQSIRVNLPLIQRKKECSFQPNNFSLCSPCLCGELRFLE